ncbi:hypothetical protein REISMN_03805 [Rickettsia tamurae subsp. buchneri]|uniref:Uncharacterized protein n=1 Tax=Rickettsia tamurae subsp. buchneri TaxID=1462938 RepID=A0A8E0WM55_9RICK|nr:hypothetical protein REISMN_03805 [Rickettsia tamurae subsp. buchneri]
MALVVPEGFLFRKTTAAVRQFLLSKAKLQLVISKKRKMVGINDLNKIDSSDLSKVDKNPDLKTNMFELGFKIIDLKKIKNNGYNLVGNHYREAIKKEKFTLVKLSKICHIYIMVQPLQEKNKNIGITVIYLGLP